MKRPPRTLALLCLLISAARLTAQEPSQFKPLELEKPATAMTMTEDGSTLLIAHQKDDIRPGRGFHRPGRGPLRREGEGARQSQDDGGGRQRREGMDARVHERSVEAVPEEGGR